MDTVRAFFFGISLIGSDCCNNKICLESSLCYYFHSCYILFAELKLVFIVFLNLLSLGERIGRTNEKDWGTWKDKSGTLYTKKLFQVVCSRKVRFDVSVHSSADGGQKSGFSRDSMVFLWLLKTSSEYWQNTESRVIHVYFFISITLISIFRHIHESCKNAWAYAKPQFTKF